jgi:hypothetical protein
VSLRARRIGSASTACRGTARPTKRRGEVEVDRFVDPNCRAFESPAVASQPLRVSDATGISTSLLGKIFWSSARTQFFVGSIICEGRCNIQHPTPNAERWFPAWSYRVTEVKDSALLARIPAMWDVLDPHPRCSYRATWRDETNSFVPSGFLFLPVWEFQRKLDSAPERSEYPARAPCLIANQTVHSLLARPALQPLAFLPG